MKPMDRLLQLEKLSLKLLDRIKTLEKRVTVLEDKNKGGKKNAVQKTKP